MAGQGSDYTQTASSPTALTLNAFYALRLLLQWLEQVAGGGGTAYTDGQEYSLAANITLYAQWTALEPSMDFGDAPDSYKTLLASDGARHTTASIFMGSSINIEVDGYPSSLANGDDTHLADDENGVTFPASFTNGDPAAAFTVNTNTSGSKLDAWIDFNTNGAFDHPSEHLGGTSQVLVAG